MEWNQKQGNLIFKILLFHKTLENNINNKINKILLIKLDKAKLILSSTEIIELL